MTRRGADKDEANMEWLLKELDYHVVKYRNLSAKVCQLWSHETSGEKYSDDAYTAFY